MYGFDELCREEDEPRWAVADRDGRLLASRLSLRQLQARLDHGLLREAAWVADEADGAWQPLATLADRDERVWYLMRHGSALVGPVATATVRRGIEAGRVPLDTYVCRRGEPSWRPIDACDEFEDLFASMSDTVTRSIAVRPGASLAR